MAKIQHYVPQFILRNFSEGKKHQVWVLDKLTGKRFKTHVRNIASERSFYDLDLGKYIATLEHSITEVENQASKLIKNILETESLAVIAEKDKLLLSQFFSIQLVRTKQYRNKFKQLSDALEEKFRSMGFNPEDIKGYQKVDDKDAKFESLNSILQSDKFIPYFFGKPWLLFKTTKNCPLYISDNPLALQNLNDYGPYGNLGLAIKGIEIYFPMSSTIVLAMYCPSIIEKVRNAFKSFKALSLLTSRHEEVPLLLAQFINGIEKGRTIPHNFNSVVNHNSLQVQFSTRYIFLVYLIFHWRKK